MENLSPMMQELFAALVELEKKIVAAMMDVAAGRTPDNAANREAAKDAIEYLSHASDCVGDIDDAE